MSKTHRLAAVLAAGAVLATAACGDPVHGVVTDKDFTPGGCSTSVVFVNGKSGVATSCTGDTWTLLVQTDAGETEVVDVDQVTYVRTDVGERYDEAAS